MVNHRVVAEGSWQYHDDVWLPVRVVESNYDFWYEIGKAGDDLDPDEKPMLNAEGLAYYLVFQPDGPSEGSFWPDSLGFKSQDEARREAESLLPGPVDWSRHSETIKSANPSPNEWAQRESVRKAELVREFKAARRAVRNSSS